MNSNELLAAGFKSFPPDSVLTHADYAYQLCVRDGDGKKYFIGTYIPDSSRKDRT